MGLGLPPVKAVQVCMNRCSRKMFALVQETKPTKASSLLLLQLLFIRTWNCMQAFKLTVLLCISGSISCRACRHAAEAHCHCLPMAENARTAMGAHPVLTWALAGPAAANTLIKPRSEAMSNAAEASTTGETRLHRPREQQATTNWTNYKFCNARR